MLILGLVLIDSLSIALSQLLAYYIRISSGLLPYSSPSSFAVYRRMALLSIPVWLSLFAANHLYDHRYLLGGPDEYGNVVKACSFGTIALVTLSFLERQTSLSRGWLLIAWGLSIAFLGLARFGFRRLIFAQRSKGRFVASVLIVGANGQGRAIAQQLSPAERSGVRVVGFLDDFLPIGTRVMGSLHVLGTSQSLSSLCVREDVEQVIVVPDGLPWESFRQLMLSIAACTGLEVSLAPGFYEILTTGIQVTHKNFVPLLHVGKMRITGLDAMLKALLDKAAAVSGIILAAPPILLIALLLKLFGTGPAIERHRVLGVAGKSFHTFKFGTTQDSRQTWRADQGNALRSWLYQTGLDKLPQLINVLAGQMSIVGPRTIAAGEEERFGSWLSTLLTVKPGVVGPWIVAHRNVSTEDEVRLDMYYVRNWTIWLDLQILFQTGLRILGRRRPPTDAFKAMVEAAASQEDRRLGQRTPIR